MQHELKALGHFYPKNGNREKSDNHEVQDHIYDSQNDSLRNRCQEINISFDCSTYGRGRQQLVGNITNPLVETVG